MRRISHVAFVEKVYYFVGFGKGSHPYMGSKHSIMKSKNPNAKINSWLLLGLDLENLND